MGFDTIDSILLVDDFRPSSLECVCNVMISFSGVLSVDAHRLTNQLCAANCAIFQSSILVLLAVRNIGLVI